MRTILSILAALACTAISSAQVVIDFDNYQVGSLTAPGTVVGNGNGQVRTAKIRLHFDEDNVGGFWWRTSSGSPQYTEVTFQGVVDGYLAFHVHQGAGVTMYAGLEHNNTFAGAAYNTHGGFHYIPQPQWSLEPTPTAQVYTNSWAVAGVTGYAEIVGIWYMPQGGGSGSSGGGGGESAWTTFLINELLTDTDSIETLMSAMIALGSNTFNETQAIRQAAEQIEADVNAGLFDGEQAFLAQIRDIMQDMEDDDFTLAQRAQLLQNISRIDTNILNIRNILPQLLADQLGEGGMPYLLQIRNQLTTLNATSVEIRNFVEAVDATVAEGLIGPGETPYLASILEALEPGEAGDAPDSADPVQQAQDVEDAATDYVGEIEGLFDVMLGHTSAVAPDYLELDLGLGDGSVPTMIPLNPTVIPQGWILSLIRSLLALGVSIWGIITALQILFGGD